MINFNSSQRLQPVPTDCVLKPLQPSVGHQRPQPLANFSYHLWLPGVCRLSQSGTPGHQSDLQSYRGESSVALHGPGLPGLPTKKRSSASHWHRCSQTPYQFNGSHTSKLTSWVPLTHPTRVTGPSSPSKTAAGWKWFWLPTLTPE